MSIHGQNEEQKNENARLFQECLITKATQPSQ